MSSTVELILGVMAGAVVGFFSFLNGYYIGRRKGYVEGYSAGYDKAAETSREIMHNNSLYLPEELTDEQLAVAEKMKAASDGYKEYVRMRKSLEN